MGVTIIGVILPLLAQCYHSGTKLFKAILVGLEWEDVPKIRFEKFSTFFSPKMPCPNATGDHSAKCLEDFNIPFSVFE